MLVQPHTARVTDTIGWGNVEVEPRPPHRSRRRRVTLWVLVVLVVAGIALAPDVKSTLGDHAAAWLEHTWAQEQGLADTRSVALETAVARMGPGDLPTYVQLLRAVDNQEAQRLSHLDASVRDHRAWAADVGRAKAAAHAALVAEIHDLRAEAHRATATDDANSTLFVPSPFSIQTNHRVDHADDLVARMVRAHHIKARHTPAPRLPAATPFLQELAQPTNVPLHLHLVVSDADGVVEWDLPSGARHLLTTRPLTVAPTTSLVDGDILTSTDTQALLLPLDGSGPRPLPSRYVFVPDGRGGLWRVDGRAAQRVAADGSPSGALHPLPAGFHADPGFNGSASPNLVSLIRQIPNVPGPAGLDFRLWNPDTGRSLIPSDACDGVTSTAVLAAYIPCENSTVRVIDMRTGRTRTFALKGGYGSATSLVLSPDGSHLAVALGGVAAGETALAFAVTDLRTGDIEVFPNPYGLTPAEWSPDSTTLVLIGDAGGSNQLAYWRPGMAQPAAIRLGVITDTSHLAVLN